MIFCQSVNAVSVVSILIGGGDTRTLTAIIEFIQIFELRGSADAKTLFLHPPTLAPRAARPNEPPSELSLPNILIF